MSDHWSREEVEAAVADYFDMLARELRGESFNKAEHNRALQLLTGRNKGSVEFKHQNISAVLIELDYPYISGYKPRFNYQDLLRSIIEERLANAADVNDAANQAVEKPVDTPPQVSDMLSILVPKPVREDEPSIYRETSSTPRKPIKRNFLELESRNRSLGRAGEELILEFEHRRLWQSGQRTLAERIQHVASSQGDGLGYDILSFEENGKERLIEVKTTRFGSFTPFFATKNEVNVSQQRESEYKLYRLFDFARAPRLFVLDGALRETCSLEPIQFSALPK